MKNILPWAIAAILLFALIGVGTCNRQKNDKIEDLEAQLEFSKKETIQFQNKYGEMVAQVEQIATTNEKTIKDLSAKVFNLTASQEATVKKVTDFTRIIQSVSNKNPIVIRYTDTVEKPSDFYVGNLVNKDSVVIPPRKFQDSTANYSIAGTVLLEGVTIDKVNFPDTLSTRTILQRPKGLINRIFKPNTYQVQSIHTNPLYQTSGIQNITLKEKPNAWNRWIKPALFLGGGVFLGSKIIK